MNADASPCVQMSPTERALIRCVVSSCAGKGSHDWCWDDINWHQVWEMAQIQQIDVLVARALAQPGGIIPVPDDIRDAAKTTRARTALHNIAIHGELLRVVDSLHAQSIPVVPLKGSALALQLFGDLGARRCGDIDILVPKNQHTATLRVLEAHGYAVPPLVKPGVRKHAFHGMPLVRQSPTAVFVIEPHWTLTDPAFVTIDDDALWARIRDNGRHDAAYWSLPPEELLLFLATHMSKHDHGLLRLLADIHQLILTQGERIDWSYVSYLAGCWSMRDMAYFGLQYATALLGTPIPPDALASLRPTTWKQQAIYSLTGPDAIMRPPEPEHLRISRFRLAYCLMMRSPVRTLRAYWQYFLLPPVDKQASAMRTALVSAQRPFVGIAHTSLAVGASIRDQRRRTERVAATGWCPVETN